MSPEVTAALIAAVVSTIGFVLTLVIGLRNTKIEREKLQADRERLQLELRESAEQARLFRAEAAKLKAETDKLAAEADEIRRRRLEVDRTEIRDLLKLFDRAVFDAPMHSEEPVEMYRAIQQTRISLQTSGASLVRDPEIAKHFQRIREILLNVEAEVKKRYPAVVQLATQYDNLSVWERRERISKMLGEDFWKSINLMMDVRRDIQSSVDTIQAKLRELDARIG